MLELVGSGCFRFLGKSEFADGLVERLAFGRFRLQLLPAKFQVLFQLVSESVKGIRRKFQEVFLQPLDFGFELVGSEVLERTVLGLDVHGLGL